MTSLEARPDAHRSPIPSSLAARLARGEQRAALTFAGQGVDPLRELAALVHERPEAAATVAVAGDVLAELVAEHGDEGRFRHGLDVGSWVVDPERAPSAEHLASCAVSHPLILLAQLAAWRVLWADGLADVVAAGGLVAATGHSQGLYAALAVAGAPGGEVDDDHLARALRLVTAQGLAMAAAEVPVAVGTDAERTTPMAAVGGIRLARLAPLVAEVEAELRTGSLVVALHNTATRFVVSGHPEALVLLRGRLEEVARTEEADRRRGRRGGTPLRFTWNPLPVTTPFHGPEHAEPLARFLASVDRSLFPRPEDLWLPVLSGADGTDLRAAADLPAVVAQGQFVAPVRWDRAVGGLVDHGADWLLDVGPGTDVARFGTELVRGRGPRVLALASPEGRRLLSTPAAAPAGPDIRYADLAPVVVELPDGRRHLDNRHTRLTGRPPVVLAGMTPTTADVAIVAAAAEAGYAAELAGSGQPTAELFRRRIEELTEVLPVGVEVGFNALFLDRHLWDLQFGREALVWRARAAGAPIDGVTVSAGIPEVDEAVALLDRLVAHGMTRNAFKPGTVEQVRQVLAIADAAPHHTVIVHLEGGKAGGHHSWEDLDDLLLSTYHDLRLRRNVVVVAGGGIATPERAADLLDGSWSLGHGEPAMPLDGVLLGTVAMATAESTASPQVKAALVAAAGTARWVPWRAAEGGVTSGRSNLDADIHSLDNAASAAGHLLEEVAGDRAAIAARHDEIAAALDRTAKPWFGDLDGLTATGVLARFTELCATGRHARYDDGAWGDPSWRAKALELYRRLAARLAPEQVGPVDPAVAVAADLDDPALALAAFRRAYPSADRALLHPADRDRFVAICAGPGKPVPFVPVIDGEVRRWYLADALWQAHDDRYPADAVFAIPGPEAVAGIVRADEPVAELLARFEAVGLDRLAAAGVEPVRRDRLGDPGPLAPHLASLVVGRRGPLAELLAAPVVLDRGRLVPNPVHLLVVAGDRCHAEVGDDGVLHRMSAAPVRFPDETVTVRLVPDGDEVVVAAGIPGIGEDGAPELVLRFRSVGRPGRPAVELVDGDASRAAWYRACLGGGTDGADGWHHDEERVAAYRGLVGAAHDGVPLDLAFTLAWPALARDLVGTEAAAARLGDLLHAEHRVVPGPAWPPRPGESGTTTVVVEAVERAEDHRRTTSRAELVGSRGLLATVTAVLITRLPLGAEAREVCHDLTVAIDAALARVLAEQAWLQVLDGVALDACGPVRLVARTETGPSGVRASGRLWAGGRVVAEIDLDGPDGPNPVDALAAMAAKASDPDRRRDRPRRRLATAEDVAPSSGRPFARVGGDRNPLHRSVLAARLAGRDEPVLHGLWTAARAGAFVVDRVAGGDGTRVVDWRVRFTAPVLPEALLDLTAEAVATEAGSSWVEVVVRADDEVVAVAEALVRPPTTALVFPGQGIQRAGMGADGRARSGAARRVWAEADAVTRQRLGFSLLDVVDRNPVALTLASGEVLRHPAGVLFRTELTQVALAALAAAQLAELDEDGGRTGVEVAAGHSIGEFNALVALGVLALDDVLELVWERGRAMQRHVPRDHDGASPYRFAALDPAAAGLDATEAAALVAEAAAAACELLEVVNHNAPTTQLALAGTEASLAELARRLAGGRRGRGSDALRPVPGIDVPFHSSVLAPAAADLRAHLERLVPTDVEPHQLVGRWIPNLVGRPFELTDAFAAAVAERTGRPVAAGPPADRARALLVDLLAEQLAAPVQWVATQQALVRPARAGGLGVARLVEVAPEHAAVLTNLATATYGGAGPELLHVARHRAALLGTAPEADVEAEPEVEVEVTRAPASTPEPSGPSTSVVGADRPVDGGDALVAVLALQARVRLDQLRDDEHLDDLFGGASSRRNQVLIDLGRELGLAGTDGVGDLTLAGFRRELAERAGRYRFPGPYLRDTVASGLARALGPAGLGRSEVVAHLTGRWGLGPGLVDHVLVRLCLDTRPGPSARGGDLAVLATQPVASAGAGRALLDRAVEQTAAALGLTLAAPSADPGPVDGAALAATGGAVTDALVASARALAAGLGRPFGPEGEPVALDDDEAVARLAALDDAVGPSRATELAPAFDARRHVRLASAAAMARWDLVAVAHRLLAGESGSEVDVELERLARWSGDPDVAATARWFAGRAAAAGQDEPAARLAALAEPSPGRLPHPVDQPVQLADPVLAEALARGLAEARPGTWSDEVALVTGASPGSIAAGAVRRLLAGGATVVVATSTLSLERRRWYRELYRTSAAPGAELHLLPSNLASFDDVDALVGWLAEPEVPQRGRPDLQLGSLLPTVVLPFAATPTVGTADEAGFGSEVAVRVQLLGVERLVAGLGARLRATRSTRPVTVVLPLSPNHGTFGGDGPYGETKAALEVLPVRGASEADAWGAHVRFVSARIGWVRGTGLMGHNDAVASLVEERLGVRTFAADEAGGLLAELGTLVARTPEAGRSVAADLTGGLDAIEDLRGALLPLGAELLAGDVREQRVAELRRELEGERAPARPPVAALPSASDLAAASVARPVVSFDLPPGTTPADLVVVVGTAELGPHGGAATRFEAEVDGAPSPAGVVELAWLCGLVRYEGEGAEGRWVDAGSGDEVAEAEIADRYVEEVVARTGVRPLEVAAAFGSVDPAGSTVLTTVHLSTDVAFEVGSEEEARSHRAADPTHTDVHLDPDTGAWRVTRRAGAPVRVPRLVPHTRRVAGQFPTGLDLARFGLPGELVTTADVSALVNLACTVEAFAEAGTTPEELLGVVHPARFANTQGAGMGGMGSLRRVLLDHLLDGERQNDRLQESLGNVVAAHVVQGYVGSYGPMVHPVAACATAAVSLEVACEKVRSGAALAVLAGGYDDLTAESVLGFADMHATASSDELDAMGIAPCEASRSNDLRRRGFVESQGGGSALVVRGDVALALGLPVQAVVAYAGSFGDGINTSIPAPGLGLLAAAVGGEASPLARGLAGLGLTGDDVAVVSKHDTATELNDPNEADVHQRLATAIGRTAGNPLLVVSQKSVTGHAKGGAAAWQLDGLIQVLASGIVPGNHTLESLDPLVARHGHLAHGHRTVRLAPGEPARAAVLTSLGFGHVSALVALAHPDAFLAAVPATERDAYRARSARRRAEGAQRRLRTRLGRPDPVRRTDRRFGPDLDDAGRREAEAALLLDPEARLGRDGTYRSRGA